VARSRAFQGSNRLGRHHFQRAHPGSGTGLAGWL